MNIQLLEQVAFDDIMYHLAKINSQKKRLWYLHLIGEQDENRLL